MTRLLTIFLLTLSFYSDACTGIKLTAKDGNSVNGRTVEFGVKVDTSITFIPRNYSFTSTTPIGDGLSYKSKYASVGIICYDQLSIMDGMNEKGLAVGTFYFPTFADYTPTTPENQDRSLSPIEFSNWLLTQFSSIDEIKKAIPNVVIAPTVNKVWGTTPPPFHYIVYDKDGKSLVIEPLNGELVLYDNPIGSFTNSPTFNWQLTNLRNYINLSVNNVPPLKIDGLVLAPFGQGSGLVGLPGDFTPPSRFVRASLFSAFATPSDNASQAVFQAFHILNQFDIPVGVANSVENGVVQSDYTQFTSVKDPINLNYYFRTYGDQTIRRIDLNAFDKNSPQVMKATTQGGQKYVDVTDQLQPVKKSTFPS